MGKSLEVASLNGLRLIGSTTNRSFLKIQLNRASASFSENLELIYNCLSA
jgi:hypothetical protein